MIDLRLDQLLQTS